MAEISDERFYLWKRGIRPNAMSEEEGIKLLRAYKESRDPEIRNQIIMGSLGLVQGCVNRAAYKFVGFWDQINPSIEDLYEMGVEALMDSLDRFDPNDGDIKFSTFVNHMVLWKLSRKVISTKGFHSVITERSLNDSPNDEKTGEKIKEYIDAIPSKEKGFDNLFDKMDIKYIQQELLPFLSKRERDVFLASLEEGATWVDLSKRFCLPEVECGRLIKKVTDKIIRMYHEGPTPLDLELKGVALSKPQIKRLQQNQEIFKAYDKEFLRQYFLPMLTPREQKIFNAAVLNYRGQELVDIMAENGIFGSLERNILRNIFIKMDKYVPVLRKRQKEGLLPPAWQPTLKQQQKIEENENYINQNGGKYFLQKYFIPVLADSQKMAFTLGVLEFHGETQAELAKVAGVGVAAFGGFLKKAQEKLALIDRDVLEDFMDGKRRFELSSGVKATERFNYEDLLKRKAIVEKYGGRVKLSQYFLPTLPDLQRQVFDLLYIQQAFSSNRGVTQYLNQNPGIVHAAEKIALEKLEKTNFDKLESIEGEAEDYLKDCFSRKVAKTKCTIDIQQVVKDCGGEMFMREVLIPHLYVPLERYICEKFFLQGIPMTKLTYLIPDKKLRNVNPYVKTLGQDGKEHRIERRIKDDILPKLEKMKNEYPDFDKAVKSFYMRKALQIFTEKELAEITPENAQEKVEKFERPEEKIITPKLIQSAGGQNVVLRNFRTTLKIEQQIILLRTIQHKTPEEIAQEMKMSENAVVCEKKSIAQKLEMFAAKKCEK